MLGRKVLPVSGRVTRHPCCACVLAGSRRLYSASAEQNKEPPRHDIPKPQYNFKAIIENLDYVAQNIRNRKTVPVDLPRLVQLHNEHRNLSYDVNRMRAERNTLTDKLKALSKSAARGTEADAERESVLQAAGVLKTRLTSLEKALQAVDEEMNVTGSLVPNDTHPEAPIGPEENATTIHIHGAMPEFGFTPKDHVELGRRLDLFDFDTGSKVTGHSFYYLKNAAALLETALVQYAMQFVAARGFTPMITPDIVRHGVAEGCGFMPRDEATQLYSLARPHEGMCLTGTAEIPIGGYFMGRVYEEKELPVKVVAFGRCFRAEAGAYGAANRGLYRVHQFSKVEMFAVTPGGLQHSNAMFDELVRIQHELFSSLGLHYRILDMPTEDLGAPAYRKFDIEAWMPGRGSYGEISSASNCTDFQARRLSIRHRAADRSMHYCHTLNGTAMAVPRIIVALLETHQSESGDVTVPNALRPYLGGMDTIRPIAEQGAGS